LIFESDEHLLCLRDSDLIFQWLELDARNVDVETRRIDKFEEIGMDLASVPEMKVFQSGEFICTPVQG
jgi:hypothetical protein